MTAPEQSHTPADASVTSLDAGENDVPAGNLFTTPKMTALDPADKTERKDVARLLESLDAAH